MYTNIPVVLHLTVIQIHVVYFKAALECNTINENNEILHRQNVCTKYIYKYCNNLTTTKSIIVEFSVHEYCVVLDYQNTVDSILRHPKCCTILPTITTTRVTHPHQLPFRIFTSHTSDRCRHCECK
jgi:hypothetical protein